jgi:hypothetical protein
MDMARYMATGNILTGSGVVRRGDVLPALPEEQIQHLLAQKAIVAMPESPPVTAAQPPAEATAASASASAKGQGSAKR